jgi:signal transduction histidine kinase
MVNRLQELEEEHRTRERSLAAAVRSATATLLEQQRGLARAQRSAAVGEMAASLAHELRNPLAGIQIACHNLRRDLWNPDHIERLDLVSAELHRLTQLLNDILSKGQQVPEPASEISLARSVADLFTLLRYQIAESICLEQRIPEDLRCCLPPGGLRQALLNLVINAAQALQGGVGTITVGAERRGDELCLWVNDDGPGFPEALLSGGLQTFASWRSGGTGLGLSMVRRFARNLGGELKLKNRGAQGATATLYVPYRNCYG